jgi:hypothetical protein
MFPTIAEMFPSLSWTAERHSVMVMVHLSGSEQVQAPLGLLTHFLEAIIGLVYCLNECSLRGDQLRPIFSDFGRSLVFLAVISFFPLYVDLMSHSLLWY